MLTHEQYTIEKAICDKAAEYARATMAKRGKRCCSITAEEAAHPDYAACSNEMRGRVELYELVRDKPDHLFAYVTADERGCWSLTTWMGDVLSVDLEAGRPYRNPRSSHTSETLTPIRVKTIWGDTYAGRALGAGLYIKLRKVA
jgi:hypothetical protein